MRRSSAKLSYKRSAASLTAGIAIALLLVSLPACNLPWAGTSSTPLATATPKVVYQNSLTSLASGWENKAGACFFGAGGYHVEANYVCLAPVVGLADVDISVQVKQISGSLTQPFGIILRRSDTVSYEFDVLGTGEWQFVRCFSGDCNLVVSPTANSVIAKGLNTSKTLEVRAFRTHFDLFVNGTKVGSTDDTLVVSGNVGVAVSKNIECVFTDITITQLG